MSTTPPDREADTSRGPDTAPANGRSHLTPSASQHGDAHDHRPEGSHTLGPHQRSLGVDPDPRARRKQAEAAERAEFGGVKIGAAFFGWLTATGMALILTAFLAAAGSAVGVANGTDPQQATDTAAQNPGTVGIVGAVVLGVVLFVAYYCGGYVAGRMARFDGVKQGVAVWLWALVVAVGVALLGAVAGSKFNVLQQLNGFPRIPVSEGQVSTAGVIALLLVAVTSIVGAILGGLAGTRYHHKIDRIGFGA